MKNLVIYTQYKENYGAHAWDGEGKAPQHWKNKGGSTYVYEDVTPYREKKIRENGIPALSIFLSHEDDYSSESIIGYKIMPKDEKYAEDWETVYKLTLSNHRWLYRRRKAGSLMAKELLPFTTL
jgi:hypothetical protein